MLKKSRFATVACRRIFLTLHPSKKLLKRMQGWSHPPNKLSERTTLLGVVGKVHDATIPVVMTIDPPAEVTSFQGAVMMWTAEKSTTRR